MRDDLIEMLECPACHSKLAWAVAERRGNRIETAEARCTACAAAYLVREGIGLFLTPELSRDDLWEQVDSRLARYLREHPEIERQLMDVPLGELAPADQFFRALVLEERGAHAEAKAAEDLANARLYTPEYRACLESQLKYALECLPASDGPIVDLASGRGYLVERMARRLERPIVATDFSPRVLCGDRRRLESLGLYDQVSLLAFDARRTPFKDDAVETLTTNLGLPNIEEPGDLSQELRRFTSSATFRRRDVSRHLSLLPGGRRSQRGRDSRGWTVHASRRLRCLTSSATPHVVCDACSSAARRWSVSPQPAGR